MQGQLWVRFLSVLSISGPYWCYAFRTSTGTCTTTTVTNWIKDISAFIKSIDKNHLVAVGDEGFFNEPSNPSYPYQ